MPLSPYAFCTLALRYTTNEGQWKESAIKLTSVLTNVRAIVNHLLPKVDSWAATNHLSSLTEKQVLICCIGYYFRFCIKILICI